MNNSNVRGKVFTPRTVLMVMAFIVFLPLMPLLISRRWDWWEAWVFAAVFTGSFVISRALAARRNPDLLAERARFLQQQDAKKFDQVLAPLVGLGSGLIPLVAGIDALYPPLVLYSIPVKIVALALILASVSVGCYALIENRYFSGMVRIQYDRGHAVVSSGPYRWVRHPGYASSIITYLAIPIFLDSNWAFLPALVFTVAIILRAALEDRTLQQELPGYREYARRTRYRLIPGIW